MTLFVRDKLTLNYVRSVSQRVCNFSYFKSFPGLEVRWLYISIVQNIFRETSGVLVAQIGFLLPACTYQATTLAPACDCLYIELLCACTYLHTWSIQLGIRFPIHLHHEARSLLEVTLRQWWQVLEMFSSLPFIFYPVSEHFTSTSSLSWQLPKNCTRILQEDSYKKTQDLCYLILLKLFQDLERSCKTFPVASSCLCTCTQDLQNSTSSLPSTSLVW